MSELLYDSDTNRAQRDKAECALAKLLRETLARTFSGNVTLTLQIKQGTIQGVQTTKEERL